MADTNPYLQLAQGIQDMIAGGNEAGAKQLLNQKRSDYGSLFDNNAFSQATANLGLGGPSGFSVDQINKWAGNPTVQSDYTKLAQGLQTEIANGNEAGAKAYYNQANKNLGSNFDQDAFAHATANLGMGGPNGFSVDQINQWAANPAVQPQPVTPAQRQAQTTTAPNQRFMDNGGGPAPVMADYVKNPYLDQMAQGITQQVNDNWTRNLAPSIRSGAVAAGGFGGSRQGVVEANALKDINNGLSSAITNMYLTDYTNDRNRALGKYQADQGFTLGVANNNLGFANLDSNNAQFGAAYGLNAANSAMNWANQGVTNATNMQNAVPNYFSSFLGNSNAIGGNGGTSTSTVNGTSNPYLAALGGAQLGYNFSK